MENKKSFAVFRVGQPSNQTEELIMMLYDIYKNSTQSFLEQNENDLNQCNFSNIIIDASMAHLFRVFEFVICSMKNSPENSIEEASASFKTEFKTILDQYLRRSGLC